MDYNERKKLIIGVCTRGNDLYYRLVDWFIPYVNQPKMPTEILLKSSPYSAAVGQGMIMEAAVAKGADYLLMLDSDIGPTDGCLEQLMSHDKDIILAPIWFFDEAKKDIHINVILPHSASRLHTKGKGLERIVSGSFGLMLVKVSALKKFKDAGESFVEWSPFIDVAYKKAGLSDNIFFAKADKLGIEAWVDWDIDGITHYRLVELCDETVKNIRESYEPANATISEMAEA